MSKCLTCPKHEICRFRPPGLECRFLKKSVLDHGRLHAAGNSIHVQQFQRTELWWLGSTSHPYSSKLPEQRELQLFIGVPLHPGYSAQLKLWNCRRRGSCRGIRSNKSISDMVFQPRNEVSEPSEFVARSSCSVRAASILHCFWLSA